MAVSTWEGSLEPVVQAEPGRAGQALEVEGHDEVVAGDARAR